MSQVPAATRTLQVLRFLATQPDPVPLARIAAACALPRSTAYHLLGAMADEGFVVHLADEKLWGLGIAAFEVGTGYLRQEPLERIARRPLAALVDQVGHNAHLATLHGRDVLYLIEERAPARPPLVSGVGVRLPASLTASGRAMLADLSAPQVRALYPDQQAFVDRHGIGPTSLRGLRQLLADVRRQGFARENGEVTPGFGSVAVSVRDHNEHPIAAVAVTYPTEGSDRPRPAEVAGLANAAADTAANLQRRLRRQRQ